MINGKETKTRTNDCLTICRTFRKLTSPINKLKIQEALIELY